MSRDWELSFATWAQGPSQTEQERAENAESQIRQAINASSKLKNRNIKVFTQGSYRNRVNVRKNSDVDVGILCYDTFFPEYDDDNIKAYREQRDEPATYTYQVFKNEIEEALVGRFGHEAVSRGNKAFDIKANTYRVEADVAAFFEHRRYTSRTHYESGVELIPDNGIPSRVRNWPEQHYNNAVSKNAQTNRRYKRVVRIIKNLKNEMISNNISVAKAIPGFLIECLVWNVPNRHFEYFTFKPMVRATLAHLFNETLIQDKCSNWGEVSELKYLFRPSQPWTVLQVHQFIDVAWDYIGLQ